jgi:secondary thiamine-phosphate synthase enzyme
MRTYPLVTEAVQTTRRTELVDVTARVQQAVSATTATGGFAVLSVPHTTAALTINENADPDVRHDLMRKLDELLPQREPYYRHSEGNSDSHLKSSLLGSTLTVIIEQGRLVLGTWQAIYLCEFDGPRDRRLLIKVIGE